MAEKRFRALRTLATLVKVLAVVMLLAGIVVGSLMVGIGAVGAGAFREVVPGLDEAAAGPAAVAGGLGIVLVGLLYFIVLYGAGEGISLLIALEQSSRDTADLMREMWSALGPPRRPTGIQPLTPGGPTGV
jgi:hypothetical protein